MKMRFSILWCTSCGWDNGQSPTAKDVNATIMKQYQKTLVVREESEEKSPKDRKYWSL